MYCTLFNALKMRLLGLLSFLNNVPKMLLYFKWKLNPKISQWPNNPQCTHTSTEKRDFGLKRYSGQIRYVDNKQFCAHTRKCC